MKMAKLTAIFIYFTVSFIGLINCEIKPRLEILPVQTIQRKPVGKSLMLTCRPNVPDPSLVTDLQWRDNSNMTILPKPIKYYPIYDSRGQMLPMTVGQAPPAMYTETLPGDQTLALLIPSLTEAMQGTYYCSASYANTQLLEVSVKIETYVAITWKNAPENQYPILGSDYKVHCEVTANPPPTVDWLRNGDPIKSGGRYVVEAYGLLIKKVQETDDGIYTCRAAVIQTGELVERNIRVEVYIKPEISALPTELEAIESQSFSTYCNATGKPPPEITWVKDQTQQNILTTGRFLVNPQTGLLTITKVEQEDYGIYTCIAKNAAGSKFNKTKLNVIVQPRIYEFYNGTEAVQKELAITCRAKGRPAPEITFRRWGSEEEYVTGLQPNDDRINLEQYANDELGEAAGTLRISKLLRSDDGLYQCIARNKGGSAYRTGHITVRFPPDFEHMKNLPPVFTWDQKPANLSCLAVSIPNATIEWRWNGRPITQLQDSNFNIQSSGALSNLIVTPRDRRYYSVYKCVATNEYGTNEIDIQLKEARRPDYVVSAKPRDVTATSITFEIIGPATEIGLPITAYIVHYKEQNMMDWSTAQKREWSPDSPYTVEGLRPQTSYDFRFAARNMVGQGEFGAIVTQSTPKRSAPEPPKLLHTPILENDDQPIVISPYSDHFELRWSVPPNNGEAIDSYRVKFCPGFKENGEWHEIENECIERDVIETTNFEMSHLKPSTLHRIELRAHNKIGFSAPASLMMKTARGADIVLKVEKHALSSAAIVGIAVGGVLLLVLIVDFLCCITMRIGLLASMCRKTKRSPSDMDEEAKLGSLYGWRFPLPYCSGQLVKEPPPSPLPLPPPVKLGGSPMASPLDEKQPLNTPTESIKKNSSVEFDGKHVRSRSGEIIGKNSAV